MSDTMKCPACNSEHAYQDRGLWVCPECGHEWSGEAEAAADTAQDAGVRDANGNVLADGDSVIVIKDLKIKARPRSSKAAPRCATSACRMPATATTSPARSTASVR